MYHNVSKRKMLYSEINLFIKYTDFKKYEIDYNNDT